MVIMFEKFCEDKDLSTSTIAFYQSAVRAYEELNNMTLQELIEEADQEEENRIRWKSRKIKDRLVNFRNYLFANKSEGTAKRYLAGIKTIYTHYEIELQSLPSFNSKQIDRTYKMDYEDLLTKSELIDAYYEANNVTKCIIVFGISSGLSKIDMLRLTVEDFITACDEYLTSNTLLEQLLELKAQNEVIPCFKDERQKTRSKYTTFCSPEASTHIVQYLLGRDAKLKNEYNELVVEYEKKPTDELKQKIDSHPRKLHLTDRVFDVSEQHTGYVFRKINNKLQLGTAGKFGRFRCHMLRKFHASTLLNSEIVTWTVEEIDTLQGRSMDITHQAYFKNSKDKLFNKYYECVDELMLFQQVHGIDEEAYEKLERENKFYKKEIVKNETKLEEQQRTINEIIKNQRELEAMLGL